MTREQHTGENVLTQGDRARAAAVAGSVTALVLVPTLGPRLFGTREQVAGYGTAVTPPDYAFAIWAPIFAGCAANAVRQCVAPASTMSRRTGWPVAGAYAANTAWSVASQAGALRVTPFLLPLATASSALAHRRAQDLPSRSASDTVAVSSTGLLLGWTALASTVNAAIGLQLAGLAPTSRTVTTLSNLGLIGTSAALAATVRRSRHGSAAVAGAAVWGLATTAAATERPRTSRLAAGVGALTVLVALARRRTAGPEVDSQPAAS